MSKVFNTSFETSLRAMLILAQYKNEAKSVDMIAAIDFTTIYGSSMGYTDTDLHGQNSFGFSEYAARRELIANALKDLVMRGVACIERTRDGVLYKISKDGFDKTVIPLCMKNEFAMAYMDSLSKVIRFVKGKTEQQIIAKINEKTTRKTGGFNG